MDDLVEGLVALEERHLRAMRWLAVEPNHNAAWRTNGRPALGQPSSWSHMRLQGRDGEILIDTKTWKEIGPFIANQPNAHQIYGLTDAGRTALANPSNGPKAVP